MATRRQKRRQARRTRKQRGGIQILAETFTNVHPSALNKTLGFEKQVDPTLEGRKRYLNVNTVKTRRNLLHLYANEALKEKRGNSSISKNIPDWQILGKGFPSKLLKTKNEWNEPLQLESSAVPNKYRFRYAPKTIKYPNKKYAAFFEQIFKGIKKKYGPAKVIFGASAVGRPGEYQDYEKNINQNFKFHKKPQTPIILIDPEFFGSNRSDFFSFLKFHVIEPESGGIVKIYKKQAGKPFEILGTEEGGFSIEQQKEYLKETLRQAEAANFDPNSSLVIYCIKAGVDANETRSGWFYELLDKYGFKEYSYQE